MTAEADRQLEAVWSTFSDRLRAFLATRLPRPEDADDVLQDTMVRIVRHRDDVLAATSISGWVWSAARSALADSHRRAARRPETLVGEVRHQGVADGDEPDDVRAELAACVRPLLAGLHPTLAEALRLVDLDGMTQSRAATAVGISLPAMKSRVQRGRRALADRLAECCAIDVDRRGRPMAVGATDCGCEAACPPSPPAGSATPRRA